MPYEITRSPYVDRIPNQLVNIAASAFFSFAAVVLWTKNTHNASLAAIAAASACSVHALTTSVFRRLFSNREYLHWYEDILRIAVNLGITRAIIVTFTSSQANLLPALIATVAHRALMEREVSLRDNHIPLYLIPFYN